jgi:hypothetical protein
MRAPVGLFFRFSEPWASARTHSAAALGVDALRCVAMKPCGGVQKRMRLSVEMEGTLLVHAITQAAHPAQMSLSTASGTKIRPISGLTRPFRSSRVLIR